MAYTEKYVTDAGAGAADGSNLANAWSWATMLTTLAAGERANYNGAISRSTANDSFSNAGTTALPISLRAVDGSGNPISISRTPGGALSLSGVGLITYTTGSLTLPAFCVVDEGLDITGAKTTAVLVLSASNIVRKIRARNTHASGSGASAISNDSAGSIVEDCDVTIDTNSASAFAITTTAAKTSRCLITAPNGGLGAYVGSRGVLVGCMIRDAAGGVSVSGASAWGVVEGCSFRNISGNYINNANGMVMIANNVAWGSGGSSVWYNSTTSVRVMHQINNAIGNMGSADVNEGDWPVINEVSLSADPFTSSTDLRLNSVAGGGALCREAGVYQYRDLGAWQTQASGGGRSPIQGLSQQGVSIF